MKYQEKIILEEEMNKLKQELQNDDKLREVKASQTKTKKYFLRSN